MAANPRLNVKSMQRISPARGDQFQVTLGRRVRELRNRRGMTRKMMAREADVSERHLAQLEVGEGNISILLLRRVAAALHVPVGELLVAETGQAASRAKIQTILARVPEDRWEEVASRLEREFGRDERNRRQRIALIGLRGAGKSTLGPLLAEELGVPYVELDREIEIDTGMPLAEIFSLYGQGEYRTLERRTLERVLRDHERAVISVGGGVVSEKETYDLLLDRCYTIWISARPEEHMARVIAQGDLRAMAGNKEAMEDLRRILASRE
ncbi:MAG TPA: helix-turn-helix transcriptional regulator, partial [Candidatus Acidoferrales bacterium]|nr:helix-turn-helix transcriptional regulator [Candidatus Acidoferrales bacterium]